MILEQEAARLPRPKARVKPALAQQLVVAPVFDDAALVHNNEAIHGRDRRKPVGDCDYGLVPHQIIELLLDRGLDLGIERRGGFVQDQDRRILQQHPRNGDALTLTAGQLHAALAHLRVVGAAALMVLKAEDELMGVRLLRRGDHLGVCRLRPAIADVVPHRAMQERGVLRDKPDLRAQAVLPDGGDILPVDEDAPQFEIVEAQQNINERGLARARRPDKPNLLARPDRKRQVLDQPAVAPIMEADSLVADFALGNL